MLAIFTIIKKNLKYSSFLIKNCSLQECFFFELFEFIEKMDL